MENPVITIDGKEYMTDAHGGMIPVANIREIDLFRDEVVREIMGKARAAHGVLADAKSHMASTFNSFVDLSVERFGQKKPGGVKGNVTLYSFDGRYKIVRQYSERLTFDEGLQAAKALIDECLTTWGEGSNNNLRTIVNHAFRVNKEGNLNMANILALRRHKIDDETWLRAMAALGESLQVIDSCVYFRVYERNDSGGYDPISLDIASL